jgi:hypothetical protein
LWACCLYLRLQSISHCVGQYLFQFCGIYQKFVYGFASVCGLGLGDGALFLSYTETCVRSEFSNSCFRVDYIVVHNFMLGSLYSSFVSYTRHCLC